jgi:hypothetical protein
MKRIMIFLSVLTLPACTTYQGYPAFAAFPTAGGPGALGSGSGVMIYQGTVNGSGFTAVVPR